MPATPTRPLCHRQSMRLFAVIGAALCVLATLPAGAVGAATPFVVDDTTDAVDASPGDGVCRTSQGTCTLRAAIMEANATASHSTILVPAGHYRITILPILRDYLADNGDFVDDDSMGDLDISTPMTIRGAGARHTIIDGNGIDRVFNVLRDGGPTTISDVTITGGHTHERNSIPQHTGGGGIGNAADLRVERTTITGNVAGFGGGVFNTPTGTLTLVDSTVSDNVAGEAGGIRFDAAGTVVNSTISGNRVYNFREVIRPGGLAGKGGGVDVRGRRTVEFINSTITDNLAADDGGGINISLAYIDILQPAFTDALPDSLGGTVRLTNTIVAGNRDRLGPNDCGATAATFASGGGNLDGDGTCWLDDPTDRPGTTALHLGPLQDNGGPTDTHALGRRSPAIGTGVISECPAEDQRGSVRRRGCDTGAYQRH